jgi:hypothetical protein
MPLTGTRVQGLPRFAGSSPRQARPLGWYALTISLFSGLAGGFVAWFSGRELPVRMDGRDLALVAVAGHKGSRLLGKACVTSALRTPVHAPPGETPATARWRRARAAMACAASSAS